ncbi:glutathione peroxidase [uncultured Amphritea sp.]|uniref:glutathione peroxidase n=1 Tax=uncultured Amphritea sp. TaxID=981605 RepID=UPI0026256491|nr:glutathione peroxidase [uncultured Amphritea sp.]
MNVLISFSVTLAFAISMLFRPVFAETEAPSHCPDILNYEFKRLGKETRENLCEHYRGKLLLVVNTASKCAYTPQYDGLEKLYRDYAAAGLVVLGFPSNDFAGQEPGSEQQILDFCRVTYNVEFPMFEKVHAGKANAHPFFRALAEQAGGEYPGWNFHKYLISPEGELIDSFKSQVKPSNPLLIEKIKANLPHG